MRRLVPLALIPIGLIGSAALAACGDDAADPVADAPTVPPPASSAPPSDDTYELPDGADEVIVSIEYVGGFAPVESVFAQLPALLVTGDGRAFTPGPQIAIYPGPLLPNVQVIDIGASGLQELAALADEHGLLQERAYDSPTNVADASDTVVTIQVGGETYVHRAYALGIDGTEPEGARAELQAFVREATEIAVGESSPFEPEQFLVRSWPVDDLDAYDVEPTVLDWPTDVDVELAAASECLAIDAHAVTATFADANQLTFFEQDGVIYQLAVKPALPGATC